MLEPRIRTITRTRGTHAIGDERPGRRTACTLAVLYYILTRLNFYTGITWPFKGLPAMQRPRNALRRTRCARTRSPWRPGLLHVLSNELPSMRIGLQRLDVLLPSCRQLTRLVLRATLLHDLNLTHEHTTQLARLTDPRANYLRMDSYKLIYMQACNTCTHLPDTPTHTR